MRNFRIGFAGAVMASLAGLVLLVAPGRLLAQKSGTIRGHVTDPAGIAVTKGDVRLTTSSNPSGKDVKWDYTFPLDANGNYQGSGIEPGDYTAVVVQDNKNVDYMPVTFGTSQTKTVDFDMTRKDYIDKLSAEDRKTLEEYKKKNAEVTDANAKIKNLNGLLQQARSDMTAGNNADAVKAMTTATTTKPDEPILWDTLGDAQLGLANADAKAAHDNKTANSSVDGEYQAAITSYQKAISLNSALPKPNVEIGAAAENSLAQALSKTGKMDDASAAYEAAAKMDPTKAGMYYFNEAATFFNANDMDRAASAADKAIAADPTKVEAYYIKGQSLIGKATVDSATNKITAPPECIAAYNKYLELAPNGPHAEEIKGILQGIGATVTEQYKAGKKK